MANHIVITRPGYELELSGIDAEVAGRIVDLRKGVTARPAINGKQIFFTDAVQLEISATEIRRTARQQEFQRLRELVPESIADYIVKYELYRETNES